MAFFNYVKVPSLSEAYNVDERVPDVGANYPKHPFLRRHKWKAEEKEVLVLLRSVYSNSSMDLFKVFMRYFHFENSPWNCPRPKAWDAMWSFLRQSYNPIERTAGKIASIEAAAFEIGVRLNLQNGQSHLTITQRHRYQTFYDWSSVEPEYGDNSLEAVSSFCRTPRREEYVLPTGLMTPPSTSKRILKEFRTRRSDNHSIVKPPIVFRGRTYKFEFTCRG